MPEGKRVYVSDARTASAIDTARMKVVVNIRADEVPKRMNTLVLP